MGDAGRQRDCNEGKDKLIAYRNAIKGKRKHGERCCTIKESFICYHALTGFAGKRPTSTLAGSTRRFVCSDAIHF